MATSLASGLRPRPRMFTAINSDVVDNNNNLYYSKYTPHGIQAHEATYIHIQQTQNLYSACLLYFVVHHPFVSMH